MAPAPHQLVDADLGHHGTIPSQLDGSPTGIGCKSGASLHYDGPVHDAEERDADQEAAKHLLSPNQELGKTRADEARAGARSSCDNPTDAVTQLR